MLKMKRKNRKGFTLVETVVVMSIVVILLAVGLGAIISWHHNALFRQNNEYAKTIFTAAQTCLTNAKAAGTLEDIEDLMNDGNAHQVANKVAVHTSTESGTQTSTDYSSRLKYLMWTPSDASKDQDDLDPYAQQFYEIVSPYLYEQDVLNAAICLEFDPADGVVYSVSYCHRATALTYQKPAPSGQVSIIDRTEATRREELLGYYDTDLAQRSPNALDAPKLTKIDLVNDDTLDLQFKLKDSTTTLQTSFYVEIQECIESEDTSGTNFRKLASFTVNDKKQYTHTYSNGTTAFGSNTLVSGSGAAPALLYTDVQLYDYNAVTNQTTEGDVLNACKFYAYVDSDQVCHVILDAVDMEAAEALSVTDTGKNAYGDTYSIMRFGNLFSTDGQNSRIQVKVTPTYLKSGKTSTTRREHPLISVNGGTDEKYYIENARHLYNLRFMEDGFEQSNYEENVEYVIEQSFGWAGTDGILSADCVFDSSLNHTTNPLQRLQVPDELKRTLTSLSDEQKQKLQNANGDYKDYAFPALDQLLDNHRIDGRSKTLSDFYLVTDKETAKTASDNKQPLALICQNKGTIEHLKLSSLYVIGTWETADNSQESETTTAGIDYVGGLCAISSGRLRDITITGGTITGYEYVGGVVASITNGDDNDSTITIEKLDNSAQVLGNSNVGGIVSRIDAKIELKDCRNAGSIRSNEILDREGKTSAAAPNSYIGGITGYNCGGTIRDCESAPSLDIDVFSATTDEDVAALLENLKQYFVGDYVGGIVGYNDEGTVSDCETTGGTIVGADYVGGIIGFNNSGTTRSEINGNHAVNSADVIGLNYVGGIVGINATVTDGVIQWESEIQGSDSDANTISNWTNEGMVVARENYAGGITGFNTGLILNCKTKIDTSTESGESLLIRLKRWSGDVENPNGRFIGGIAGYNNGMISSESHTEIVAVAAGDRYIGGIVGYNDENGDIENYYLQGGYLSGESFVGGITGVNVSPELFTTNGNDSYVVSSPNVIEGNYFVGGLAGANLMASADKEETVLYCDTDNFLGNIKGRDSGAGVFVGGTIGYNALLKTSENNIQHNASAGTAEESTVNLPGILALANTMADTMEDTTTTPSLSDRLDRLEDTYMTADRVEEGASMTVLQDNSLGIGGTHNNELNQISGAVYVAGVIGYSQADSHLTLQSLVNQTPVVATSAVTDANKKYEDLDKNGEITSSKQYSYAGGIIGRAGKNVTIDHCHNSGAGSISTPEATYHGTLVEVNEGQVINCSAQSVGEYGMDCLGGLVGVNGYTLTNPGDNQPHILQAIDSMAEIAYGYVCDCSVDGIIIGRSYVGGIAAENFGKIENITFSGGSQIQGDSACVGGITGDNRSMGTITDIKMEHIDVTGSGTCVGGIAGRSAGAINVITEDDSVRVTGTAHVGGMIGQYYGKIPVSDLKNQGTVTAVSGNAGGVIGSVSEDAGSYQINGCINEGSVEAQRAGNAGGIVSNNTASGTVSNCENTGEVQAGIGNVGGIAAVNAGTIKNCRVHGSEENSLELTARKDIGGICSDNQGVVTDCRVSNLTVTNQSRSSVSRIGGITGVNEEGARVEGASVTGCMIAAYTANSSVGGVAGVNYAILTAVSGDDEVNGITDVAIGFTGTDRNTINGNLGGITGQNTGTVSGWTFRGTITGNSGEDNGYGGVTGINTGSVSDCSVCATITVKGDQSNITNIGGAVGINRKDASVSEISLEDSSTLMAENAYIGGIVGRNYGTVRSINTDLMDMDGNDLDTDETAGEKNNQLTSYNNAAVQITTALGQTGGIVGENETTGLVENVSTGSTWALKATKHQGNSDNAIGGVIGYNYSANTLKNAQNLAYVEKTLSSANSMSGIVGRWEHAGGKLSHLENCVNRGTVSGSRRVGGIVGQWKYGEGVLRNCVNYGNVKAASSGVESVAGIVGYFYQLESGAEINFVGCRNEGTITNTGGTGAYAAGIAGYSYSCSNADYIFQNCVNAGTIISNGNNSGIFCDAAYVNSAIYNYCRNYGRSYTTADCRTLSKTFGGISYTASNAVITNCYGVSNVLDESGKLVYHPISNGGKTRTDNYVFGKEVTKSEDVPEQVEFNSCTLQSGNPGSDKNTNNIWDKDKATRWETTQTQSSYDRTFEFTYEKQAKIYNVNIYWYAGGTRTYSYKLGYHASAGDDIQWFNGGKPYSFTCNYVSGTNQYVDAISGLGGVNAYSLVLQITNCSGSNYLSAYEVTTNEHASSSDQITVPYATVLNLTKQGEKNYDLWYDSRIVHNLETDPNNKQESYDPSYDFRTIDPKLQEFMDIEQINTPSGVMAVLNWNKDGQSSSSTPGQFEVSWKPVSYEDVELETVVTITIKKGNETISREFTVDTATGSKTIPVEKDWIGDGSKATVSVMHRVKTGTTGIMKDSNVYTWTPDFDLSYIRNLPSPQFHLELTGDMDKTEYSCAWENAGEYPVGSVLTVAAGTNTLTVTKTAEDEEKESINRVMTQTSGMPNGQVLATGTVSYDTIYRSGTVTAQARGYKASYIKTNTVTKITSVKAAGQTPSTLSLTVAESAGASDNHRVELMGYDDDLGVEVALAGTQGRIPDDGTSFQLSDLPTDFNYDLVENVVTDSTAAITNGRQAVDDQDDTAAAITSRTSFEQNPAVVEFSYHKLQNLQKLQILWKKGYEYTYQLGYRRDTDETVQYLSAADQSVKTYIFTAEDANDGIDEITLEQKEVSDIVIRILSVKNATDGSAVREADIRELKIFTGDDTDTVTQQSNVSLRKFTKLRSYLWSSQGSLVWYAKEVAWNMTAEELLDPENGYMVENEDGSHSMADDYLAQLGRDGRYTVLYSPLYSDVYKNHFSEWNATTDTVTAPLITPEKTFDAQNDTYIFHWDENVSGNNTYDVTLTGYSIKGDGSDGVVLYNDTGIQDKSITVSASSWKYTYLELTVTKYGTTNNVDFTKTVMGSSSTQAYDVKLPLSRVVAPTISLPDKDEQNYEISWSGIVEQTPEPGNVESCEYSDLDHYEVIMKNASGQEVTLGTVEKNSSGNYALSVDFEDSSLRSYIAQGDTVQIYVNAIARADAAYYQDSPDGVVYNFTLRSRMITPLLTTMKVTVNDQNHTEITDESGGLIAVTEDVFTEDGFYYTITNPDAETYGTCIYQAYYCTTYETETDADGNVTVGTDEDGVPIAEEMEAYNGGNSIAMGGNPTASYSVIHHIDRKYAGGYLLIRARTISDNAISSLWSDYIAVQLPRIRLSSPEYSAATYRSEASEIQSVEGSTTTRTDSVLTDRMMLGWVDDSYVSSYEVELHSLLEQEGAPESRYDFKILKPDEFHGYQISMAAGDYIADITATDVDLANSAGAETAYIYDLGDISYLDLENQEITLPGYTFTYRGVTRNEDTSEIYQYEITLSAQLQILLYADGSVQYRVVLPDCEVHDNEYLRTRYVKVAAEAYDGTYYEDSLYRQWIRIQNSKTEVTATRTRELLEGQADLDTANLDLDSLDWNIMALWRDILSEEGAG